MSEPANNRQPNLLRVRLALVVLLLVGVGQIIYGFVGPSSYGGVLAEAIVEQLNFSRDAETQAELARVLSEAEQRRGLGVASLGLLVAAIAAYGLKATFSGPPSG